MSDKIPYSGPTLDDMPEHINILYYGEPGSGKTSSAAAMAHLGPVYFVDAESGAKARPLRKLGIPVNNIRPVGIESYKDIDKLYWTIKAELDDEPGSVAGVVFDSMTEIQQILLREEVDTRYNKSVRKATDPRTGDLRMEIDDNPFDVELKQHGVVTEKLRLITRNFRDLPCHTAFTALAKREIDSEGTGFTVIPQLSVKFGTNLRGYVDIVAVTMQASGVEDPSGFLAVLRETGKYKGKNRIGGLPPVMANPAFDRIVSGVFDDLDFDNDPDQQAYLSRVAEHHKTAE